MALLRSVVSFIAFSVHFMFSLINYFRPPRMKFSIAIEEGTTAAVLQQRTLLLVSIF